MLQSVKNVGLPMMWLSSANMRQEETEESGRSWLETFAFDSD